jgi:hypothetical protein
MTTEAECSEATTKPCNGLPPGVRRRLAAPLSLNLLVGCALGSESALNST